MVNDTWVQHLAQRVLKTHIDEKVSEWCQRLSKLSDIAKSQPHVAYAAYTHGEQHRYTYFMRTLANISENLEPIDKVLEEQFLPALFGREVTDGDEGAAQCNYDHDHHGEAVLLDYPVVVSDHV